MGLEIDRVEMLSDLHNVTEEQLKQLADAVDRSKLKDGYILADYFSGDGVAASTLLQHITSYGVSAGVVILVDYHTPLLDKSADRLGTSTQVQTLAVDLSRNFPKLTPDSIDIAVIKMGLHEMPFPRQSQLLVEIYRTLKIGGQIIIWENNVLKENGVDIFRFNEIIAEKDRLAGLAEMSKQRYFTSGDELHKLLTAASFKNITVRYKWVRTWDSYTRLSTEFKNDLNKLVQLNTAIDRLIPLELREKAGYNETNGGLGRSFHIYSHIASATK